MENFPVLNNIKNSSFFTLWFSHNFMYKWGKYDLKILSLITLLYVVFFFFFF